MLKSSFGLRPFVSSLKMSARTICITDRVSRFEEKKSMLFFEPYQMNHLNIATTHFRVISASAHHVSGDRRQIAGSKELFCIFGALRMKEERHKNTSRQSVNFPSHFLREVQNCAQKRIPSVAHVSGSCHSVPTSHLFVWHFEAQKFRSSIFLCVVSRFVFDFRAANQTKNKQPKPREANFSKLKRS